MTKIDVCQNLGGSLYNVIFNQSVVTPGSNIPDPNWLIFVQSTQLWTPTVSPFAGAGFNLILKTVNGDADGLRMTLLDTPIDFTSADPWEIAAPINTIT